MLHKLKMSVLVLPMVVWIGSYFVPAEFSRNSYFKDAAEIENAIYNYADAFYEADPQKIHRSSHPTLMKRGSRYNVEKGCYEQVEEIGFNQLVEQAESSTIGSKVPDSEILKNVVVYDVQDFSATARLTSAWGVEYFHLSKINGKWYIMNVLWQSPQPL